MSEAERFIVIVIAIFLEQCNVGTVFIMNAIKNGEKIMSSTDLYIE